MPNFCQEFSVKKQVLEKPEKPLPIGFSIAPLDKFWKARKHEISTREKTYAARIFKSFSRSNMSVFLFPLTSEEIDGCTLAGICKKGKIRTDFKNDALPP